MRVTAEPSKLPSKEDIDYCALQSNQIMKQVISALFCLFVASTEFSASADSRSDLFFAKISQAVPGEPALSIRNSTQSRLISWLRARLENPDVQMTRSNLPFLVAAGLRNAYLAAPQNVFAVQKEVFDLALSEPSSNFWGHCGTSADFMILFLEEFGIAAKRIGLFNWPGYSHTAVEFYSDLYGSFVYYDPLYGVYLLLPEGEPAGISDILEDIQVRGFDYLNWKSQPLRIFGFISASVRPATDPAYEEFNSMDYGWGILRNYFFLVADRFRDTTHRQTSLPGEDGVFGKWKVFDNTGRSYLSSDQQRYFVSQFKAEFSADRNGRYYLAIFKSE